MAGRSQEDHCIIKSAQSISNEGITIPGTTLLQNKFTYNICDLKIGQAY